MLLLGITPLYNCVHRRVSAFQNIKYISGKARLNWMMTTTSEEPLRYESSVRDLQRTSSTNVKKSEYLIQPLANSPDVLTKKAQNFRQLMRLRHLHEGPNRKNRPTQFLASITELCEIDINQYIVGKEIFITGMPTWIQGKLRKLHEEKRSIEDIAQFADDLLAVELMDFPNEILLKILNYLHSDPSSLVNISKVCKQLSDLTSACTHGHVGPGKTAAVEEHQKPPESIDSAKKINLEIANLYHRFMMTASKDTMNAK